MPRLEEGGFSCASTSPANPMAAIAARTEVLHFIADSHCCSPLNASPWAAFLRLFALRRTSFTGR